MWCTPRQRQCHDYVVLLVNAGADEVDDDGEEEDGMTTGRRKKVANKLGWLDLEVGESGTTISSSGEDSWILLDLGEKDLGLTASSLAEVGEEAMLPHGAGATASTSTMHCNPHRPLIHLVQGRRGAPQPDGSLARAPSSTPTRGALSSPSLDPALPVPDPSSSALDLGTGAS